MPKRKTKPWQYASTITIAVALACMLVPQTVAAAEKMPSPEDMWAVIQAQQRQIADLMKRLDITDGKIEATEHKVEVTEQKVAETEEKVEAAGAMIEETHAQNASGGDGWWQRTSLGGYGEMHYNGGNADEIDFHRFVLYVGHEFNDRIRLKSEIELEHSIAGEGKNGEVELEQAFVEFDINDQNTTRAGLFLIPVGIMNETHEPPTFYGVERNPVEKNIIPTTWWEGGVSWATRFGSGFSVDLAAHSGLDVPDTGGNAYKIRSGRKKVSKAPAKDLAYTGRVKWSGMPGVEVAVTGQYQGDITQGNTDTEAFFIEAHTNIQRGPFGLRALYARWDLNGPEPKMLGRDEQYGWYVEPSYRTEVPGGEAGIFVRYNEYDMAAGGMGDSKYTETSFGINYWPHPDVVLKFDYQFQNAPQGEAGDDRANLGVGFQF
ncbi:MAG TPA: porin [Sneathiellales bacterium]|nr:porin [Sneathiellales bacterium]